MTLGRITVIEEASSALLCGLLDPELRARAAGEAHRLSGSLGALGFSEGFGLAHTIKQI